MSDPASVDSIEKTAYPDLEMSGYGPGSNLPEVYIIKRNFVNGNIDVKEGSSGLVHVPENLQTTRIKWPGTGHKQKKY
jgi:hypothetical protein